MTTISNRTRYAIHCTPGGLLRDGSSGKVICFNSYAEAEAEALRLTRQGYSNPRVAGIRLYSGPGTTRVRRGSP